MLCRDRFALPSRANLAAAASSLQSHDLYRFAMPVIAYSELTAFEKRAEGRMQSLSFWKLPHRSLYSTALLGLAVDDLYR